MALQTKTVQTGDYSWKSWSNSYVISLTLTEEAVDIAANTSLVKYLFTISNTDNNRFTDGNNSWSISIGGQEIPIQNFYFALDTDYTTQTIVSGQVILTHNADGKLQMPYNVSIPNIRSWNRYGPPAMALTGVWELTPIPRASTLSCPVGIIGKPVTVTVQKANENYRHTITYDFGGVRGTIAEQTDQEKILWTLPTEFYGRIPNAKRGVGSLFCKAYDGQTLVGETSCLFYADIDEGQSCPEITAQVEDVNEATTRLTGDPNTLIRYYSNVRVTADYTAKNSATLVSYVMQHNGKVYAETDVSISHAESGIFAFSATDSRGLTRSVQVEKPLVPYIKLTCNLANSKPDGEGNMPISLSGNFFAGSFGRVDNSLTVQYRYKLSGTPWQDTEEEWQTIASTVTGNTYTANTVLTGLNYQQAYTVQARAVDSLATVRSGEYTARAIPVFDWGERDFAIHGDLSVDGKVIVENTPVLTTPHVQTYYWKTEGGVNLASVGAFMATCKQDCAFITMMQGTGYPFVGVAVGSVCQGGRYGAGVLYDYAGGAQSFRLLGGELI